MITVEAEAETEAEGEAEAELAALPIPKDKGEMTTATTAILQRFGDEESTLLDRHERLSFQLHLDQVLSLTRSASSQSQGRRKSLSFHFSQPESDPPPPVLLQPPPKDPERRRCSKLRFQKLLNRLLKPIFPGRKPSTTTEVEAIGREQKDTHTFENKLSKWKAFSRSSRL